MSVAASQKFTKDFYSPPTELEITEEGNIRGLVWRTEHAMENIGLTAKALQNYHYQGFGYILRKYHETERIHYGASFSRQIDADARLQYERNEIGHSVYHCIRKAIAVLDEFYASGELKWERLTQYGFRQPAEHCAELLSEYKTYLSTGVVKETMVGRVLLDARKFLLQLEDCGISCVKELTLKQTSELLTRFCSHYQGGLSSVLSSIRLLFKFLYSHSKTDVDLRDSIPNFVARRRPLYCGFSDSDIGELLSLPNLNTVTGKRDYAIMMLGSETGLRACDVALLKLCDIDWKRREIHIVQAKTGVPLTLPLPIRSGNAIAEYILNARAKCDEPHVFLSIGRPFRALSNRSISGLVTDYAHLCGIDKTVQRCGFHSFRRSYGLNLLTSGTRTDMLMELLGQTRLDSVKPYMAIDENGLKRCALSLASCDEKAVVI